MVNIIGSYFLAVVLFIIGGFLFVGGFYGVFLEKGANLRTRTISFFILLFGALLLIFCVLFPIATQDTEELKKACAGASGQYVDGKCYEPLIEKDIQ